MYLRTLVNGPASSCRAVSVWSCHILETSVRVERHSSESSQRSGLLLNWIRTQRLYINAKLLALCNNVKPKYLKKKYRVMEEKEWLYIFARLRGNTLGPLPGEQGEVILSAWGYMIRIKAVLYFSSTKLKKDGVADKIRVCACFRCSGLLDEPLWFLNLALGGLLAAPPLIGGDTVVNLLAMQETPCVREIPWRRKWQPTPVFLSGKFHGQRSLAGYSPLGHKSWPGLTKREHPSLISNFFALGSHGRSWKL